MYGGSGAGPLGWRHAVDWQSSSLIWKINPLWEASAVGYETF